MKFVTRDAPWQLIVALVLVNVVIAVLLDEFSKAAEKSRGAFIAEDPDTERCILVHKCESTHTHTHILAMCWCTCISCTILWYHTTALMTCGITLLP